MACCVAVVYLFSLAWRTIRWLGRLVAHLPGWAARPTGSHPTGSRPTGSARVVGSGPARGTDGFAPPARREVRLPAGVSAP